MTLSKDCTLLAALLLALVVGLKSQRLIITDPPQTFQCLNISEIEICSQIGYEMGSFPNWREQEDISVANRDLNDLLPLIQTGCSEAIVHMLCAVYAPLCVPELPNFRLAPCKELCTPVRDGCEDDLLRMGFTWPPVLECDQYPSIKETRLVYCVDDVSALRIPDNIVVNRMTKAPPTDMTTKEIKVITDAPQTFQCLNISEIEICSQIGYEMGSFPNWRDQHNIIQANQEISTFLPLIQTACSEAIVHLLCAVYAPFCQPEFPHIRLPPCRELCQFVRDGCEETLLSFGFLWPPSLDCDRYPSTTETALVICVDNVSALRIPDNIMVNRITPTPTEVTTRIDIIVTATPTATTDPCDGFECPSYAVCKVFTLPLPEVSLPPRAFCDPSCDLDNGGCEEDEICTLIPPVCPPDLPCPFFVQCSPRDPCAIVRCRNGYACKVHPPTGEAFCEPSCDLNNGGCSPGTHCILRDDTECTAGGPCPPLRSCCPHPRCDMDFCSARRTRRALCTNPRESCGGQRNKECSVTFCHTCYFSQTERALPGNCSESCRNYNTSNMCSRRWATCIRRAHHRTYGQAWLRNNERLEADFYCYNPPCVQN